MKQAEKSSFQAHGTVVSQDEFLTEIVYDNRRRCRAHRSSTKCRALR